MAKLEVGNVSGMDAPTTDHSTLLTLTPCPALSFLPIPTTLPTLCSRPYPPNSTLVYFAHPSLKLSRGEQGACGYVERGSEEWLKKRGDGKEGRKGEEAMRQRKEVQPLLDQRELFTSFPNAY